MTNQTLLCCIHFRVTHSTDPKAFHGLFDYLEDNIIYKDKAGMWQCIHAVAGIVFEKFLDRMAEKVNNEVKNYIQSSTKDP